MNPHDQPVFDSVDNYTADLLDLLAYDHPARPSTQWDTFVEALAAAADPVTGLIDQNDVRPRLRHHVDPRRIGAFYHKAATLGLIAPAGWSVSDDTLGRNSGRPMRVYRWHGRPGPTSPASRGGAAA